MPIIMATFYSSMLVHIIFNSLFKPAIMKYSIITIGNLVKVKTTHNAGLLAEKTGWTNMFVCKYRISVFHR